MKISVIQPYYSFDGKDTEKCYNGMMELFEACECRDGIIVLPEYTDVPAAQSDKEAFHNSVKKYNADALERAKRVAVKNNAIVFVNCADYTATGIRNTTFAINRSGEIAGKYYKAHPAPSEVKTAKQGGNEIDVSYSYEAAEPYVIEIDGIRFGFMTCYDFYFYESFAPLARMNVDVIIGCSHQRTDTHRALDIINRFLSYNTNAYLVRSSVSLGEDSDICGCSCIIAPTGEVLVDMKSRIGIGSCEIDPKKKYYKAAGFKGQPKAHYEYVEEGRRPWLYRNGGAGVVAFDDVMPYPRLCAHRGFSTVAPENSMPAFGAAIGLGASEIELDVWATKDGEIVSCHDSTLERVSDGTGKLFEHTLAELQTFDFGKKFGERFAGLRIVTLDEVLKRFASRTVMNIHVKPYSLTEAYPEYIMKKIVALVRRYDSARHCYFMLETDEQIRQFKAYAPDIPVCVGHLSARPYEIVDRAIELGCEKVQLFKPYFNDEMITKAHEHGIRCNIFYADDIDEAKRYIEMGIDTILTNDYLKISTALGIK